MDDAIIRAEAGILRTLAPGLRLSVVTLAVALKDEVLPDGPVGETNALGCVNCAIYNLLASSKVMGHGDGSLFGLVSDGREGEHGQATVS